VRILHLEKSCYDANSLKKLEEIGKVSYHDFQSLEDLHLHLQNYSYEVIFTKLGLALGAYEIALQPDLKYIITPTTGLNHIDLKCAAEKDIEVISLKGEDVFLAEIKSTAEHAWLLLLSLIRNFPQSFLSVKTGRWERAPFLADELDKKRLGLIGFGRLGKIIAGYGYSFGMEIAVFDRRSDAFSGFPWVKPVSLETLLNTSDYVIMLLSYEPENIGIMNAERFQTMKPTAYFINVARGELVDEQALVRALESGDLKGAALDVLDGDSDWQESIPSGHPLLDYARNNNNLLLTPHMGGYGKDSIKRTRIFIVNKFLQIMNRNESY
jgi:D-3-phosphoglycerate dehydrogenase